jgi:acyl-coenzyme A thioesterase PaaI-like protein
MRGQPAAPFVTAPAAQDQYAPHGICFGCGPANEKGLRIKSRWEGDDFVMRFRPWPEHQAFPGVVNGGILGTLLDCHSNWCASTTLLKQRGLSEAPTTVTAEFHVKLKRPTPADAELLVTARPTKVEGDVVNVHAEILANGKVTATCEGVFVAVKPGHPAYHRWG